MFCYRGIMDKMNHIPKRSLPLLLKNCQNDFQDLLRSSSDIFIHQRCINSLLIEVYKYIHGLSSEIRTMFSLPEQMSIIHGNLMFSETSNRYELNSIPYKANQLWNLLPENLKSSPPSTLFKSEIKLWECFDYPCNICKS